MYISTRGGVEPVTASKAIYSGLAPDGGLFVPQSVPCANKELMDSLDTISYQDLATEIFGYYLDDFTQEEIKTVVNAAYGENFDDKEIAPLHKLNDDTYILELWHGPTAAFKDMALQALPHLLKVSMQKQEPDKEVVILVATSGDTGKAALEGFGDVEKTKIIVFYPKDGVSEVQRLQMVTTTGKNTTVVALDGNFDHCQTGVKSIFNNVKFNKNLEENNYKLSSANSINWGRLLPQIVYYFKAYGAMVKSGAVSMGEAINVVVPTGNFGNILAGYYAKAMGLPLGRLVCASNKNNVLTDVLNDGEYNKNRDFYRTVSPSMDILISSNFERFVFEMNGRDADALKSLYADLNDKGSYQLTEDTLKAMQDIMSGYFTDEDTTLATIGDVYKKYDYLMDTHTAVAVNAWEEYLTQHKGAAPAVVASTANPYKFNKAVYDAINQKGSADDMDEFTVSQELKKQTGVEIHRGLQDLDKKEVLHNIAIDRGEMLTTVAKVLGLMGE
ncbi:MAG: threonine synthase [Clostridiales bacterium]